MKVILLKDVQKVGKKNTVVDIADGYAQQVLFPKKWAIPATPQAISNLHRLLQKKEQQEQLNQDLFLDTLERVQKSSPCIYVQTNEKGILFSRLDKKKIKEYLSTLHFFISEDALDIPHEIKQVGEHTFFVLDQKKKKHPLHILIKKQEV